MRQKGTIAANVRSYFSLIVTPFQKIGFQRWLMIFSLMILGGSYAAGLWKKYDPTFDVQADACQAFNLTFTDGATESQNISVSQSASGQAAFVGNALFLVAPQTSAYEYVTAEGTTPLEGDFSLSYTIGDITPFGQSAGGHWWLSLLMEPTSGDTHTLRYTVDDSQIYADIIDAQNQQLTVTGQSGSSVGQTPLSLKVIRQGTTLSWYIDHGQGYTLFHQVTQSTSSLATQPLNFKIVLGRQADASGIQFSIDNLKLECIPSSLANYTIPFDQNLLDPTLATLSKSAGGVTSILDNALFLNAARTTNYEYSQIQGNYPLENNFSFSFKVGDITPFDIDNGGHWWLSLLMEPTTGAQHTLRYTLDDTQIYSDIINETGQQLTVHGISTPYTEATPLWLRVDRRNGVITWSLKTNAGYTLFHRTTDYTGPIATSPLKFKILVGRQADAPAIQVSLDDISVSALPVPITDFGEYSDIKSVVLTSAIQSSLTNGTYTMLGSKKPIDVSLFDMNVNNIKATGFNTLWLGLNWVDFEPSVDPVQYNEDSFSNLLALLDRMRTNNMKAILPINYLFENYKPAGVNYCTWTADNYDDFVVYTNELMDRLANPPAPYSDFSDMVYLVVFTEGSEPCDLMEQMRNTQTYNLFPQVAQALQNSIGRLPKDVDQQLRAKFKFGYHDYSLIQNNWSHVIDEVGDTHPENSPIHSPNAFDFLSFTLYNVEQLSPTQIATTVAERLNNFQTLYPTTPVIVGETGASYCPSGAGSQAGQATALEKIISALAAKDLGLSIFHWFQLPRETTCQNNAFNGLSLTTVGYNGTYQLITSFALNPAVYYLNTQWNPSGVLPTPTPTPSPTPNTCQLFGICP